MGQQPEPRPARAKGGKFKKGEPAPKNARRKKGTPNHITSDIRRDVIAGLARHGSDGRGSGGFQGYVFMLAKKYPKTAARLVERILPLTVKGDLGSNNFIGSVNIVSVPTDRYLTADDIDKLAAPGLIDENQLIDITPDAAKEPVSE